MITTGAQLTTFMTGLNADATIDADLLDVLVDNAKAVIEEERPWAVLKKTDSSKAVSAGNTWQTAIDLSTISDFSRLYVPDRGTVLKLFDGGDRVEYYSLKPFVSYTCVYDENAKILYLNGTAPFAGTLWIPYIATSAAIDLASASAVWTNFPSRFLPILAYYANGIFKGAVDYDSINRQMLPSNQAAFAGLKNAMVTWDNEKQLAAVQASDPSEFPGGNPRSGAINRYDN